MDCFRSISPELMAFGREPRMTTSNVGLMTHHEPMARLRGLNKLFYSMLVKTKSIDDNEIKMLQVL